MAYTPNKSDPDYIRGLDILKRFYDASKSYNTSKVKYTFDQMIKTLESRSGQAAFIEGLGLGVNASGFSNSKIQNAMVSLARQSNGQIPEKNQNFRDYLIDKSKKINFVDAVTYVAVESTKDIVKGAQAVGDSVLLTGKLLTYALPLIIGTVVYFWIKKQK